MRQTCIICLYKLARCMIEFFLQLLSLSRAFKCPQCIGCAVSVRIWEAWLQFIPRPWVPAGVAAMFPGVQLWGKRSKRIGCDRRWCGALVRSGQQVCTGESFGLWYFHEPAYILWFTICIHEFLLRKLLQPPWAARCGLETTVSHMVWKLKLLLPSWCNQTTSFTISKQCERNNLVFYFYVTAIQKVTKSILCFVLIFSCMSEATW